MTLLLDPAIERPDELPRVKARPVWGVALKRTGAKFSQDQCTDKAAALTYFSMQSLFPGLIAVLSLINVFGNGKETTRKLVQILAGILGKSPNDPSLDKISAFINTVNTTGGGWIALVVGVLVSLWSASGYVGGFSRALNKIYDVQEGRPFWVLRPTLLLVTAIEVVLIIVVMVALVASGSVASEVGKQIGLGSQAVQVWDLAKWPVVVFIIVFIIGMLYWASPNVRKMKRDIFSWGALVAFAVWVVGSVGLVLYVGFTNGSSYEKTYGAFAGAIIFMLWLWITNLAMLFGAELDAELIRTRQLRAGLDAELVVQLPVRDGSGIDKKGAKEQKLVARAVTLRDEAAFADLDRLAEQVRTSDRKDETAMAGRYDAAQAREHVAAQRAERRIEALKDAKAARKVRDRLERQEAKAKKRFNDALKQVKKERKARETAVTVEQQRGRVEEIRARYAPRSSAARTQVEAVHKERRAAYDARLAEKRASRAAAPPRPPKPPKARKPPMPSVLRSQVEHERAQRRTAWYAARGRSA